MQDEIYTVEKLASIFQMSKWTIYKKLNSGELNNFPPAFKVGNQWRWRRKQVEKWIEKQEALS